jgi:DNA-binding NarL/FixJ family response regulator
VSPDEADGDVTVLVVDDDRLVRLGLRGVLAAAPGVRVIGEAADGAEAVSAARALAPDVVLLDIRMPHVDGIEATRRLVRLDPAPGVVVMTTFDLDEYVHAALKAGACGFLLKDAPEDRMVAAVRAAGSGVSMLDPRVTMRLVTKFARPSPTPVPGLRTLTAREQEVMVAVARGWSNDEVGRRLGIGEATVKTHVSHLLEKLDLVTRVQLVVLAYEAGLVRPGEGDR